MKYTNNDEILKLSSKQFINKKYEIGSIVDLKINPPNPHEFISPEDFVLNKVMLFMGIGCIIGGLMPIIFTFIIK